MRLDDTLGLRRVSSQARGGPAGIVALLLVLVSVLGSVVLGGGWLVASRAARSVEPVESIAANARVAPILSARRIPDVLSDEVRFGSLRSRVAPIVASLDANSCLFVEVEGRTIAKHGAGVALMPGSVVKLLTAAVALEVLGPDHRFSTEIRGRVVDGRVVGPLFVVGGGDPVLSSAGYAARESNPTANPTRIERIAETLRAAGINAVTGGVVGVEGRYDRERWSPELSLGVRGTEVGPLGSLFVNDGWVLADPIKPADPTLAAAREVLAMLASTGFDVGGAATVGALPADVPVIGTIESEPLSVLLGDMLANSDNNSAELLLKELGLVGTGTGSRVAGISVVVRVLTEWGIPMAGVNLIDGSGLERGNRLTCDALAEILRRDGGFSTIAESLAIPGVRGTLRATLADSASGDRMRAKTGTLTGAKSLAGYVRYAPDRAVQFVLVLNGPLVANQSTFLPLWERLADALGALGVSPTADDIRSAG